MITSPQEYSSRIKTILGNLMGGAERRNAYLRCKTIEEVMQRIKEIRLM
jgi:hypothetical protein